MSGMVKCIVDGCDKELRKDTLCNHYITEHPEWIPENTIGLVNRNGRLVINNIPNYKAFKSSLEGNPEPLIVEYKSSEGDDDLYIDCASKIGFIKKDTAIKHISSMPEKHRKIWLNIVTDYLNNNSKALYNLMCYIEQKPQEKIIDAEVNAKLIKEKDDALAKAKEATDDAERFRDIARETREESFVDKYNDTKSLLDCSKHENKQLQSQIDDYKKNIKELKIQLQEAQESKLKANLSDEIDELGFYERHIQKIKSESIKEIKKAKDEYEKQLKAKDKEVEQERKRLKKKYKKEIKDFKKKIVENDSDSDSIDSKSE
jgi:hypothetical protein